MEESRILDFIKQILEHIPSDWLRLTTHRLDIYNEERAKVDFLEHFTRLSEQGIAESSALRALPTAFDYIRLGHPLSSVLEWTIAKSNNQRPDDVISFSSRTMGILAVLRHNKLNKKKTKVYYTGDALDDLDLSTLRSVYQYDFEIERIENINDIKRDDSCVVFVNSQQNIAKFYSIPDVDIHINIDAPLGSVVLVSGDTNREYIASIQHVRRRESIAMTPADTLIALKSLADFPNHVATNNNRSGDYNVVTKTIKEITGVNNDPLIGSSGLSIQYAIMMGLVEHAKHQYPEKDIKFIVPTNCYGGTNDQARRVAACIDAVDIVDLAVDGDNDMVQSLQKILSAVADEDAVPYIIAEIPTNPRVEVPDLNKLREVLNAQRNTKNGGRAIDPVFILDQTFCPNIPFLSDGEILSTVPAISYVSGSKFPSGGLCTAGYCVGNDKVIEIMRAINKHLIICDNEATDLQIEILSRQLPSMNSRIKEAYENTRVLVNFIEGIWPEAKINFVSESLALRGFTPSVFSLDLPTHGVNDHEREVHKRALNYALINLMISEIPHESKFCVSYGQLKGVYWTIPAMSTQGTTKEGDKDYIVRIAVSPDMDMELHQKVFADFVSRVHQEVA